MKFAQRIILLALFCSAAFTMTAQTPNKRTVEADTEFANGGYVAAAEAYQSALPKLKKDISEKARVLFQIGECYREVTKYDEAEEWYKKAITAKYDDDNPIVHYNYGEILRLQGKYDEAVVKYQKYIEKGGDQDMAEEAINSCEQAVEWIEVPPTRYLVEQEPVLNSKFFDYSPVYSSKKYDEVVFSSARQSSEGKGTEEVTGENYMDLFMSTRDKKGKWSTPVPLNNTINTEYSEGTATFDKKFKNIYFSRCVNKGSERVGCDLYTAKRSGNDFGIAEMIVIVDREKDDSTDFAHPTLSPDDEVMVFASDMKGGQGGSDLWMMTYDRREKKWSDPVNLGKDINTADNEVFPYIHENGTLYFSSDGMNGMGGFDIYKAESTGENKWGNPINLQYPINSSSDDFGITFESDMDAGMFTSNRAGGKGKDDIYTFRMPPLEFGLSMIVYDEKTLQPLPNTRVMITESPGGDSYDLTTDSNGGLNLVNGEIEAESTYKLVLSNDQGKPVYIGQSDQFSTVGLTESTTVTREYFLIPIEDEPIRMPLVLYEFDKATLVVNEEVNSQDSLNYLYQVMIDNPTFVVELQSHTDSRGGADYNMELSQRRAQTCVDYLISKGIERERLEAKGMGESALLIPDSEINKETDEDKIEALHQKNRRTVFRVIGYDYKPKEE